MDVLATHCVDWLRPLAHVCPCSTLSQQVENGIYVYVAAWNSQSMLELTMVLILKLARGQSERASPRTF
jgi:hypothetical protein